MAVKTKKELIEELEALGVKATLESTAKELAAILEDALLTQEEKDDVVNIVDDVKELAEEAKAVLGIITKEVNLDTLKELEKQGLLIGNTVIKLGKCVAKYRGKL